MGAILFQQIQQISQHPFQDLLVLPHLIVFISTTKKIFTTLPCIRHSLAIVEPQTLFNSFLPSHHHPHPIQLQ